MTHLSRRPKTRLPLLPPLPLCRIARCSPLAQCSRTDGMALLAGLRCVGGAVGGQRRDRRHIQAGREGHCYGNFLRGEHRSCMTITVIGARERQLSANGQAWLVMVGDPVGPHHSPFLRWRSGPLRLLARYAIRARCMRCCRLSRCVFLSP